MSSVQVKSHWKEEWHEKDSPCRVVGRLGYLQYAKGPTVIIHEPLGWICEELWFDQQYPGYDTSSWMSSKQTREEYETLMSADRSLQAKETSVTVDLMKLIINVVKKQIYGHRGIFDRRSRVDLELRMIAKFVLELDISCDSIVVEDDVAIYEDDKIILRYKSGEESLGIKSKQPLEYMQVSLAIDKDGVVNHAASQP